MKTENNRIKNIAGVVILFDPDKSVVKNISSYFDKIQFLYIIDNSKEISSSISQFVEKHSDKLEYVFNNGNLGVASGLNIAIDKAQKDGYAYLLTMDQDSFFESSSLEVLIDKIADADRVGILSPFHKNRFFTNPPKSSGSEEVSDVMTSGNILNLSVIQKIGKFREDYFIDYVDIEYCFRLRQNGFKIIRINNSFLNHNEANLIKKKFLGVTVYPQNHSAVRWYYKIRNYLYLKEEYGKTFREYFETERKNVRNSIIKVLLFESQKIKKIRMILIGYAHYRKRVKGKYQF